MTYIILYRNVSYLLKPITALLINSITEIEEPSQEINQLLELLNEQMQKRTVKNNKNFHKVCVIIALSLHYSLFIYPRFGSPGFLYIAS